MHGHDSTTLMKRPVRSRCSTTILRDAMRGGIITVADQQMADKIVDGNYQDLAELHWIGNPAPPDTSVKRLAYIQA